MPTSSIVLIGPVAAGKSTTGAALATLLDRPFVDVDELAGPYYAEVDQTVEQLIARAATDGFIVAHEWWQPARVHAVERVLAAHRGSVIALGAGHSHFEGRAHFDRVAAALRNEHVVLLLPNDDPAQATDVLRGRCLIERGPDQTWRNGDRDMIREWVESDQNRELADEVVITDGMDPTAVAAAISELVR